MELFFWIVVILVVVTWLFNRFGPVPTVETPPVRPARDVDDGFDELYRAGMAEGYKAAWDDIAPVELERFRAYVRRAQTVAVVFTVIGVVGVGLVWWFWVGPAGSWVEGVRARPWWQGALVASGGVVWALGFRGAWPRWPALSLAHQRGPEGIRTLLDERLVMSEAHPSDGASRAVAAVRERLDASVERERESAWAETDRAGHERGRSEGFEKGRVEGFAHGRDEGLEQGREEGLERGRSEGLEQGRAEDVARRRAEGLDAGRSEGRERARRQGEAAVSGDAPAQGAIADVAIRERLAYARGIEAGFELGRGPVEAISGLPLLDWWGHHPSLGWLYVDREELVGRDGTPGDLRAYVLERDRVVDLPRAVWELSCRSAIEVLTGFEDADEQRSLEGLLLEHLRHRDRYAAAVRRTAGPS